MVWLVSDRGTKSGDAVKEHLEHHDRTALLYEAENVLRAIRHGSAGLQRDTDPAAESQRLADAWKAMAERAFPGSSTRER